MSNRLYYNDSYLTRFHSRVVESLDDGLRVVLESTAFYPSSGGQPNDFGHLNGIPVTDVIDEDERIVHVLAAPLTAPEVEGIVESAVNDGLGKFFEENSSIANKIIEKAVLAAKAREAAGLSTDPRVAIVEPDIEFRADAQTVSTGVLRVGAAGNPALQIDVPA